MPEWTIEEAAAGDLEAIRALLTELGLPAADVGTATQRFVVARSGGELVGCAALEIHGRAALLRSLAVRPAMQGRGLGNALYQTAIAKAGALRVGEVFLLTTTAIASLRHRWRRAPRSARLRAAACKAMTSRAARPGRRSSECQGAPPRR